MKYKYGFIIPFIFLFAEAKSQENVTFYLNSKFEFTSHDRADCTCRGLYDLEKFRFEGQVTCTFLNGTPRLRVTWKNGWKNGPIEIYDRDGKPVVMGSYYDDLRSGIWREYYSGGRLKQVIKFTNFIDRATDANILIGEYNDEIGNPLIRAGSGTWKNDSIYSLWMGEMIYKMVEGEVKDSLKHGIWEARKNGSRQVLQREKFKDGKVVSAILPGTSFGTFNSEIIRKYPDRYKLILSNLEHLKLDNVGIPDSIRYAGEAKYVRTVLGIENMSINHTVGYRFGEYRLREFISDNLVYPAEAKRMGYQGMVIVQFTVAANGKTKDFRILKGAHESLNKEALRVVQLLKDWIPTIHEGKSYEKLMSVPVGFQL